MKQLRTRQAKVLGALGVFGAILCGAMLALLPGDVIMKITAGCGIAYSLLLAFEGLNASSLILDGDDILISQSGTLQRIDLGQVASIRTFPIFRYVGVITLRFRGGEKFRTMVADQDLTWIMSRMPSSAVTSYWRNRTGREISGGNGSQRR